MTVAERYLTHEEKARELDSWRELRRQAAGRQLRPGSGDPDPEVYDVTDRINEHPDFCTVQSCAGHGPDQLGRGRYQSGLLWLRATERGLFFFQANVDGLLAHETIEQASVIYGRHSAGPVIEVVFRGQERVTLAEATAAILSFFEGHAIAPPDRLAALFAEHMAWKRATFPRETIASAARHLADEAAQLLANPSSGEEYADVRMLLWSVEDHLARLTAAHGIDLAAEVEAKLAVNRARIWKDRGDGVWEHVRS